MAGPGGGVDPALMATFLAQQAANGLFIGMSYALAALGLTIVFGLLRVVNFAHGEFTTVTVFIALGLTAWIGNYGMSSIGALLMIAVLALVVYRLVIAPISGSEVEANMPSLLATYGLSLLLVNFLQFVAGPGGRSASTVAVAPIRVAGLLLETQKILLTAVAVVALLVLTWTVRRTSFGRMLRAVSQNERGAWLVGIPVNRVKSAGFVLGCTLAGLSGLLSAPSILVTPQTGQETLFKTFVVVILGGLGSIPGAVAAGILLGLVEAFGGALVSTKWTDAYGFALLILVLIVRGRMRGGFDAGRLA